MTVVPQSTASPRPSKLSKLQPPWHRIRTAGWYVRVLKNWPAVLSHRLVGRALTEVKFRGGPKLLLHDPVEGLGAVYEIFRTRAYTRDLSSIPLGGTVVDLGANVGIFTVFAATELVPRGRVIAVEANPGCADALTSNLARNALRAEFLSGAVTARPGPVTFWVPVGGEQSQASSLNLPALERQRARAVQVEGIALAEIVRRCNGHIDLLKVDIEGGEHALAWDTTSDVWVGIERIAMELHFGTGSGYPSDATPVPLAARFRDFGYTIKHLEVIPSKGLGFLILERPQPRAQSL